MAKASELTYTDYRESIELAAEEIVNELEEYDDYDNVHDAIHQMTESSDWIFTHGKNLMCVLLSDINPDNPDYTEGWNLYAGDCDSWSDAVSAMAFTCMYNDIADYLDRNTDLMN